MIKNKPKLIPKEHVQHEGTSFKHYFGTKTTYEKTLTPLFFIDTLLVKTGSLNFFHGKPFGFNV